MDINTIRLLRLFEPIMSRIRSGARRAREAGIEWEWITPSDVLINWDLNLVDPFSCFYCGTGISDPQQIWHMDHGNALARGGSHRLTNLVPSCAPCNLRKKTKHWYEFMDSERLVQHENRFLIKRVRERTAGGGLYSISQTLSVIEAAK